MWQHIFRSLRRRRSQSLLTAGGFLLAACALILLSATTQTTALRANQIIHQNWRSSYDLVVLPPEVHTTQGAAIPADTLQGYNGGISMEQYQQVKALPGIEVAAPLAFVGYVQLPTSSIKFSPQSPKPGYYRATWTLTAFNGRQHIVERHISFYYAVLSTCDQVNNGAGTQLQILNVEVIQCGPVDSGGPFSSSGFSINTIDTGTFLLAAVDPIAENQLLHINNSIVKGRMLQPEESLTASPASPLSVPGDPTRYDIPLLYSQQPSGKISLHLTTGLVSSDTSNVQALIQQGGSHYLAPLPEQQNIINQDVPLIQNDPQRFSNMTLAWTTHGWKSLKDVTFGANLQFLYTPSGLTYQKTQGPGNKPSYTLVPAASQSPAEALKSQGSDNWNGGPESQQGAEVFFRNLHPLQLPTTNTTYYAKSIGQFNPTTMNAQFSNALNWLPEATYSAPPLSLQYDAQGHPITPTNLIPTTNPAGMTIQPPLALTTLRAASQVMGQRPIISVIRVRLSGVNMANDESWKKVEQVAQLIHQRTGLRALVTLGSSPSPTLVYVPGLKQGQNGSNHTIAPLGWVEERWVAIGISLIYLGQVGQMQLLLLGTLLIVCLGYLIVTLSSLVTGQRRELAMLSALGWRPWQPATLFLSQALLLALGGGLCGIGLALLLVSLIGATLPWLVILVTLPAILILALLSSLYPLWQIWQIQPAEILRSETTMQSKRAARTRRRGLTGMGALALQNVQRMRTRSLVALVSLFLSAALLVVMLDSLLSFQTALKDTLLGSYVLLQTAVPQLAGAIFALILTFLSVSDLLLLHLRERRHEIGLLLATGWRPGHIQRLFVQEGLTLALLGTIPGVLVAMGILFYLNGTQQATTLLEVGLSALLLMILIASLATIPVLRSMMRIQLMDVIRAE
jgi:ABC-type lipoprotein release transport system permease subunit